MSLTFRQKPDWVYRAGLLLAGAEAVFMMFWSGLHLAILAGIWTTPFLGFDVVNGFGGASFAFLAALHVAAFGLTAGWILAWMKYRIGLLLMFGGLAAHIFLSVRIAAAAYLYRGEIGLYMIGLGLVGATLLAARLLGRRAA